MDYKRLNNIVGWTVFAIATITYFMTIEPTTSFWDCGEYIATSVKLQVGHPPGAPFFQLMGNLFGQFAGEAENQAQNAAAVKKELMAYTSPSTAENQKLSEKV